MGVYMAMFVGPHDPIQLNLEQFEKLIVELLQQKLVSMPGAVYRGEVYAGETPSMVTPPFNANEFPVNMPYYLMNCEEALLQVLYAGEDEQRLIEALRQSGYGTENVGIWFNRLGWDKWENGDVFIHALAQPGTVQCVSAYIPEEDENISPLYHAQFAFWLEGKRAPADIEGTEIEAVLKRYFGPELISCCSYI